MEDQPILLEDKVGAWSVISDCSMGSQITQYNESRSGIGVRE